MGALMATYYRRLNKSGELTPPHYDRFDRFIYVPSIDCHALWLWTAVSDTIEKHKHALYAD